MFLAEGGNDFSVRHFTNALLTKEALIHFQEVVIFSNSCLPLVFFFFFPITLLLYKETTVLSFYFPSSFGVFFFPSYLCTSIFSFFFRL